MDAELAKRLDKIERMTLLAAKRVLTVRDVAYLMDKAPKTIYNMLDELPHYRNAHGIYFKRDEIEAWQCQVQHKVLNVCS